MQQHWFFEWVARAVQWPRWAAYRCPCACHRDISQRCLET